MSNRIQIFGRSFYDSKGNRKIGRKTIITYVDTPDEAIKFCSDFNKNRTAAQVRRSYKYEWTSKF